MVRARTVTLEDFVYVAHDRESGAVLAVHHENDAGDLVGGPVEAPERVEERVTELIRRLLGKDAKNMRIVRMLGNDWDEETTSVDPKTGKPARGRKSRR